MVRGLDGFFDTLWRCAVLKDREGWSLAFSGGFGEGETPLPIPNRAVKPLSADGTWPARAWESRTPPVFLVAIEPSAERRRLVAGPGAASVGEPHAAVVGHGPVRVVRDLPRMAVGIDEDAGVPAPERLRGLTPD